MAATVITERLDRWVEAGLLTREQADAIAAHEGHLIVIPDAEPEDRSTLAAEAVGYLGAALAVIAGGLVVSRYWPQIEVWGRLTLLSTLALATFGAGWWVRGREEGAIDRLVSVLWAGTAVAVAFTAGIAGDEVLGIEEAGIGVLIGVSVAIVGGALYRMRMRSLQQIALAFGIVTAVESALALPDAEVDLMVSGGMLYVLGLAWFLLAAGGWLRPARTGQVLGVLGLGWGAQLASFGSYTTVALTVALVTTAVALAAGAAGRSTLLLASGVFGAFVFVPQFVQHLFGDTLGAPFVLFVTGMVLIGVSVGSLRLRQQMREATP